MDRKSLSQKQQAVLRHAALHYEDLEAPNPQDQEAERARHAAAGMETITLSPDDERAFLAEASDAAWTSVLKWSPQTLSFWREPTRSAIIAPTMRHQCRTGTT